MTPEQEEQVARALAETARSEPVPPLPDDVAARLDDVLADLVSARGADAGQDRGAAQEGTGASVDVLAARRRRRRPRILAAAAAVALVVAAGGAVVNGGLGISPSSDESASSSAGDSGSGKTQPRAAAGRAEDGTTTARAAVPRLRTSSLRADVRRVLAGDYSAGAGDRSGPRRKALTGPPLDSDDRCVAPSAGPGERALVVRLDGRPATLLLGPVRDGTRTAEVYSCGDAARPVAGTTVPLP
jgi:hypothetical protein